MAEFIVVFKEEHITYRTVRFRAATERDAQQQALEFLGSKEFYRVTPSAIKDQQGIDVIRRQE
jgi:hypothetical protein